MLKQQGIVLATLPDDGQKWPRHVNEKLLLLPIKVDILMSD
jgi:hypothetical protein